MSSAYVVASASASADYCYVSVSFPLSADYSDYYYSSESLVYYVLVFVFFVLRMLLSIQMFMWFVRLLRLMRSVIHLRCIMLFFVIRICLFNVASAL